MGLETNIESIVALEKQIEDGEGDVIKLKRTRNSLINISTGVPPEILGSIFAWIVTREQDHSLDSSMHFVGLDKGSHNFLLVCHHWFEVASNTSEVWAFWGKTLEDWNKRCHRVGPAPVDLVLNGYYCRSESVDPPLHDALRDCAFGDKIRQIHLFSGNGTPFYSIVSSLTPDEDFWGTRIESIIIRVDTIPFVLSHFFSRSRLPNLRCL